MEGMVKTRSVCNQWSPRPDHSQSCQFLTWNLFCFPRFWKVGTDGRTYRRTDVQIKRVKIVITTDRDYGRARGSRKELSIIPQPTIRLTMILHVPYLFYYDKQMRTFVCFYGIAVLWEAIKTYFASDFIEFVASRDEIVTSPRGKEMF